jgi:ankyrin repeat protein
MTAACAYGGSLVLVKRLLKDHRFGIGSETLRYVAEEGHLEIMDALLSDSRVIKDMAINPRRGVIYSNIMAYAASKGHLAIVQRLYVYSFIDPFYGGESSSMYYACCNRRLNVIQYFLQDSRCIEKVKNLCFYDACHRGNLDVAQLLYHHGANPLARTPRNSNIDNQELWLPFTVACQNGRIEIVKFLLQIEMVQTLGDINSGLLHAATGGYFEIVELLSKNSRVDADTLNLAFRNACLKNHTRVVDVLLKDSRIEPDYNDNDALVQAVTEWKFELAHILMNDSRVDPCARDYMLVRHVILHTRKHFHNLFLKHPKVNPKCIKYSIPKLRKQCETELSVIDILNNDENKLKR